MSDATQTQITVEALTADGWIAKKHSDYLTVFSKRGTGICVGFYEDRMSVGVGGIEDWDDVEAYGCSTMKDLEDLMRLMDGTNG